MPSKYHGFTHPRRVPPRPHGRRAGLLRTARQRSRERSPPRTTGNFGHPRGLPSAPPAMANVFSDLIKAGQWVEMSEALRDSFIANACNTVRKVHALDQNSSSYSAGSKIPRARRPCGPRQPLDLESTERCDPRGHQGEAPPAAGLCGPRRFGRRFQHGGARPRRRRGRAGRQGPENQPAPAIVQIVHGAALAGPFFEHTPAGTRTPLSLLALDPEILRGNLLARSGLQGQPHGLHTFDIFISDLNDHIQRSFSKEVRAEFHLASKALLVTFEKYPTTTLRQVFRHIGTASASSELTTAAHFLVITLRRACSRSGGYYAAWPVRISPSTGAAASLPRRQHGGTPLRVTSSLVEISSSSKLHLPSLIDVSSCDKFHLPSCGELPLPTAPSPCPSRQLTRDKHK